LTASKLRGWLTSQWWFVETLNGGVAACSFAGALAPAVRTASAALWLGQQGGPQWIHVIPRNATMRNDISGGLQPSTTAELERSPARHWQHLTCSFIGESISEKTNSQSTSGKMTTKLVRRTTKILVLNPNSSKSMTHGLEQAIRTMELSHVSRPGRMP